MAILLTGCSLSNSQQMEEVKKCEDAGYEILIYKSMIDYSTLRIECDFAKGKTK